MSKHMHHSKRKKRFKKRFIIIPTAALLIILFVTGGWLLSRKVFSFISSFSSDEDNGHSQGSVTTAQKNEKILVRVSEDSDPVYINAIEGMPKNSYDDNGFYLDNNGYLAYRNNGKTLSAIGVDVSYVQEDIDWEAVKNSGIEFAFIRCAGRGYGEKGVLYTDDKFTQNVQGAISAGLDVGVYFYSQAITVEEAREEAEYTLDLIKDYEINYPVVFDWEHYEYDDARTDDLDRETLTNIALEYCSTIEEAGYTPMVYANRSLLYFEYDLAKLADTEIWLASYEDRPDYYYDFGIWQYTTEGAVDGIKGNVDLNICLYDYKKE